MRIEERVERLERELRQYRWVVGILVLIVVAGVSVGQTGDYEQITCRSLRVIDHEGREAVTVEPWELGGRVSVRNKDGVVTTQIGQSDYGSGMLAIHSRDGEERVRLVTVDAGGAVEVSNKHNETVVDIYPDESGNGRIGTWTRRGTGRLYEPQ